MSGFNGIKSIVDAELEGRVRNYQFRKNPTQATTAGIWFDFANAAGNPKAKQWFDASPLTATQVYQSTDLGLYHGANVLPAQKHIRKTTIWNPTVTALPMQMLLLDYLLYYPTFDDSETGVQTCINTPPSSAEFTASYTNDLLTYTTTNFIPANLLTGTLVTVSTTGTLPLGLSATDYYLIRVDDSTCRLAATLADARNGVCVNILNNGSGTHTLKWILPRWTNGDGVQMMAITTGARTGGQTFTVSYTNSDGVAGRTSGIITQNTSSVLGTITNSALTVGQNTAGPFITLQSGDSGVRSVQSVQMNGVDTGFFSIVLVKQLTETQIRGIDAPVEKDHLLHGAELPRIYDDAFLGFIGLPNGTLATAVVTGNLKVIFN